MSAVGIYRIVNTVTERTYLGSSIDVRRRLRVHRRDLRCGTHANHHLQGSWKRHGEAAFVFESLTECEERNLPVREQAFLDAYRDHDLPLYNLKPSADSRTGLKYKHRPETLAKMSASNMGNLGNTGKTFTPEHCAKIGAANKRRIYTSTMRANMSAVRKGKPGTPHTQEFKVKMSLLHKGKKHALGCHRSPETRARMSAAQLKRYADDRKMEKH